MKQLVYSWPTILLVAVITFFFAKGAVGVMLKERESAERVAKLEAQASAMEAREALLKEGIARLQTDEGVREEIKEKFSVTEEGEYVAIIVDERLPEPSEAEALPWYKKLWNAIIRNQ
jgi:cell division protein FtsB